MRPDGLNQSCLNIDEFKDKGFENFPKEFIKNPRGFMKYRDAISRMGKDYNKG